eukprot:UN32061
MNFYTGSKKSSILKALKRYDTDLLYRCLYETVAHLFARQLRKDLAKMKENKSVSLCSKWTPSLDSSYDKRTFICEGIARKLYPKNSDEKLKKMDNYYYGYFVRNQLRKDLTKLREHIKVCERLMSTNRWKEIEYEKVPSVCMTIHANNFANHDKKGYQKYIESLESGKVKAKAGALDPVTIITTARNGSENEQKTCRISMENQD